MIILLVTSSQENSESDNRRNNTFSEKQYFLRRLTVFRRPSVNRRNMRHAVHDHFFCWSRSFVSVRQR
jgi:hypothetical protein